MAVADVVGAIEGDGGDEAGGNAVAIGNGQVCEYRFQEQGALVCTSVLAGSCCDYRVHHAGQHEGVQCHHIGSSDASNRVIRHPECDTAC